jgi:hypothetical protein
MAPMVELTPLQIGDTLIYTQEVEQRVLDGLNENGVYKWSNNLYRGLVTEYGHNLAFEKAGMKYYTANMSAPYDRLVGNHWQDDKCAMWSERDGVQTLADTHTLFLNEMDQWEKETEDVIIHSFTQAEPGSKNSVYHGAISFRKLYQHQLIRNSKFNASQLFFSRKMGLKLCPAT